MSEFHKDKFIKHSFTYIYVCIIVYTGYAWVAMLRAPLNSLYCEWRFIRSQVRHEVCTYLRMMYQKFFTQHCIFTFDIQTMAYKREAGKGSTLFMHLSRHALTLYRHGGTKATGKIIPFVIKGLQVDELSANAITR